QAWLSFLLPLPDGMASERLSHGGQHLFRKGLFLAGAKARKQRRVSVGTGTAFSKASKMVQRPLPESCTYPFKPSSFGSSCSADAVNSKSHERTTLPCIHRSAILARSRLYWLLDINSNPSA